jgi:hypothetical protein
MQTLNKRVCQTSTPVSSRLSPLAFLAALGSLLALAGVGCQTASPSSFASVTIQGKPVQQIAAVTTQVFREAGYSGGGLGSSQMVFQKAGSQMTNLAYEGVVGTHYGQKTQVRVKVDIVSVGGGAHRLQCQAYIVRDAGDSFFEEETALTKVRSGPYKSLLKTVAERLK